MNTSASETSVSNIYTPNIWEFEIIFGSLVSVTLAAGKAFIFP